MKKIFLTAAIALLTTVSFSQKKNITSAAMAYQSAQQNAQEPVQATKDLMEAKTYIDLAIANPETKEDPKALMYKGKIYIELAMRVEIAEDKSAFEGMNSEKMVEDGFSALKHSKEVDSRDMYSEDIDQYCGLYRAVSSNLGIASYGEKKYKEAMGGLLGAAAFGEIMGVKDSMFYFFGGLAALEIKEYTTAIDAFTECIALNYRTGESVGHLATCLKETGKEADAEQVLKDAVAKYPENVDVLIQMANFYIDKDQNADAVAIISEAIKLDPKNVILIYHSGVLYELMEKFDEAEAAYLKAIELDPKYTDAKYSLGVYYFNRGADLNNTANDLPLNDPKADAMLADAKAIWSDKCVPNLESALEDEPKDIAIMEALKTVYGKLGMTEKFMEMKKRIAEVEG